MDLHPALEPLRPLIGTWSGEGRGDYPSIDAFSYREELRFEAVGPKPFLLYSQRTRSLDGAPMHVEAGYLRLTGPESSLIELVLAQPTGQTELAEGPLTLTTDGLTWELTSRVVNSSSARHVEATMRRLALSGDELRTAFSMATDTTPMTDHLFSTLQRVG